MKRSVTFFALSLSCAGRVDVGWQDEPERLPVDVASLAAKCEAVATPWPLPVPPAGPSVSEMVRRMAGRWYRCGAEGPLPHAVEFLENGQWALLVSVGGMYVQGARDDEKGQLVTSYSLKWGPSFQFREGEPTYFPAFERTPSRMRLSVLTGDRETVAVYVR